MNVDPSSPTSIGLKGRLARALKLKPSRARLTKKPPPEYTPNVFGPEPAKGKSPLELHKEKYKDSNIDTQLGERKDVTALLHGLTHRESFESFDEERTRRPEERKPGEEMISSLSSELWEIIANYLAPADAANLVFSSKTLRNLLGLSYWDVLNLPENRQEKLRFLIAMDCSLPFQLFCFPCAQYHVRVFPGKERLKQPGVLNPLFVCPNARSYVLRPPRTRLTPTRNLPFTFLQLALRAHKFSPEYGVPIESLSRRWKEGENP